MQEVQEKKKVKTTTKNTTDAECKGNATPHTGGGDMKVSAGKLDEESVVLDSGYKRVVTTCHASVDFPWTYEGGIPKGGIEVKVRLEEDDKVIERVYFHVGGWCTYEFCFSGRRRLNSAIGDEILNMTKDLWVSVKQLVIANKDFLFLNFHVVAGSYLVANLLVPSIAAHVRSIVDNLQKSWSITK
jgi:hypothetical protein